MPSRVKEEFQWPRMKRFGLEFAAELKHKNSAGISSCAYGSPLALRPNECHVWYADLSASAETLSAWEQSLSSSELQRAGRFHWLADRRAYVARHGILRCLLGSYLQVEPGELSFSRDAKGKPQLHPLSNPIDLRFNLSRSGQVALFALTRGREVGVDIEWCRPMPDWESIAQVAFSADELAALHHLPADQRLGAFFRGWTQKEAVLKAMGDGIAAGMKQLEVSLALGARACSVAADGRKWSGTLHCWQLAPDLFGAVAVVGSAERLVCRSWDEATDASPMDATDHSIIIENLSRKSCGVQDRVDRRVDDKTTPFNPTRVRSLPNRVDT